MSTLSVLSFYKKIQSLLPTSTLQGRLMRGLSAQAFSQGVSIIIRLLEVPLFLSFWGPQRYGEWLMLAAIPTYLSMGDGGFTQTSCRDITIKGGAGDQKGALVVYQSTWALLVIISIVICLFSAAFSLWAPISEWLNFSSIDSTEAAFIFFVLTAYVLLGFQGSLLNSGFWLSNRYPQSMFWGTIGKLLEFAGVALPTIAGGGPLHAALGYLIGRFLGTLIMFILQIQICPWLKFGFHFVSFNELKRLLIPSFASLAFPLGVALNIQGIRLIVGLVLGPAAVAIYVPLRTLSNFVVQPRQIVNQIIEPEMASAFGSNNTNLFQKLFLESVRISFWSCLFVAVLLVPVANWLYPYWTSGKVELNWPVFVLLLVAAVINSIWYSALMVSYATNRHGLNALFFLLIYGLLFAIFSFFVTKMIGIIGPPLVLIFAEGVMTYLVVNLAIKMTGVSVRTFLIRFVYPPYKEMIMKLVCIH